MATKTARSGQRVSSSSSLRMFWTVLKPISGRNRPNASSPATAASRSARVMLVPSLPFRGRVVGRAPTGWGGCPCASTAISHLLDFRPAQYALGEEDQRDGEDREGGDILVVDGEIGRPQGLDQADQQPAEHGARQRADAAQYRGGER